jgi:hypothetical protein
MSSTGSIDTGKVTERRALRFETISDLRADLERIEKSERAGTLRRTGNWTPGQVLGHLATWAEFSWNPNPLKPPWFVRCIVRRGKDRYLNKGMPAGVRIPRVEGGTLGTEAMTLDAGLSRYRAALDRLEDEPPTEPSPIFGVLTHEECIKGQLRHAELHLSFLHP